MSYQGCERDLIYSRRSGNLYHYRMKMSAHQSTPILVVFALVNSPQILDLHPKRSFIDHLLQQNLDVYFLEWGRPTLEDKHHTLSDYILGDIHLAVRTVSELSHHQHLHLMGICQGGYLSLCYGAMFAENLISLIPIVTPVDFNVPCNRVFQLTRFIDIDKLVDTFGNMPGSNVNWMLQQLEPFRTQYKKFKAMQKCFLQFHQENIEIFSALEAWGQDCPDQAGETLREFVKICVQENALVNGNLLLNGNAVKLSNLKLPILNIYAMHDHIWPPETVKALAQHHQSSCYEEYAYRGGHVGIFASAKALKIIPPLIRDWVDVTEGMSQ